MIDVSRNGVLTPEAARAMLRRCALMGLNMAILYSEDTYEVPGEPFFGYLRGRYTHDEMKSLDDYADALGIEMFPCIQTLAPPGADPPMARLRGIPRHGRHPARRRGEELRAARQDDRRRVRAVPLEAHPHRDGRGARTSARAGSGELHGEKRPFDIFNDHLARVRDLCRKRGLRPMIWSDMYFHLGSKTGDYYDRDCVIPPDVVAKIPRDVQLVYWDYYHYETEFYRDMIRATARSAPSRSWPAASGRGTISGPRCRTASARQRLHARVQGGKAARGLHDDVGRRRDGVRRILRAAGPAALRRARLRGCRGPGAAAREFPRLVRRRPRRLDEGGRSGFRPLPGRAREEPGERQQVAALAGPAARADGPGDRAAARCAGITRSSPPRSSAPRRRRAPRAG